jgi:hypothetical protein
VEILNYLVTGRRHLILMSQDGVDLHGRDANGSIRENPAAGRLLNICLGRACVAMDRLSMSTLFHCTFPSQMGHNTCILVKNVRRHTDSSQNTVRHSQAKFPCPSVPRSWASAAANAAWITLLFSLRLRLPA